MITNQAQKPEMEEINSEVVTPCSVTPEKWLDEAHRGFKRASRIWEERVIGNRPRLSRLLRPRGALDKRHSYSGAASLYRMPAQKYNSQDNVQAQNCEGPTHGHRLESRNSIKEHFLTIIAPDDNKACVKFFGTKQAVHLEKKRLVEMHSWIIHPYSCFK
ncbi:unnamed protein product [Schistocephalus solidus]|uniref:Ion_trans_N domain-containing protein n=1 Tax=Schistocephalus solidus TaxID=70667 RepID=A0A183SEQ2_SCHSO|nr:unnamed protein product [Schistocephalus solidus]